MFESRWILIAHMRICNDAGRRCSQISSGGLTIVPSLPWHGAPRWRGPQPPYIFSACCI